MSLRMLCKSFDKRGFACARGTMEQQPELVRITRDLILSFLLSVERSIPAQRERREKGNVLREVLKELKQVVFLRKEESIEFLEIALSQSVRSGEERETFSSASLYLLKVWIPSLASCFLPSPLSR
jgi:hypothetical protein